MRAAALLVVVVAVAAANPAFAQEYPARAITLIVPTPPGGGIDVAVRSLADRLAALLGKPVVVDNKAGAAGRIAMVAGMKAAPDGHVMVVGTAGSMTIYPHVYETLGYDPVQDFEPVARFVESQLGLVAHPGVPAKTFSELLAWLKAGAGPVNYASYGAGTPSHFYGYLLGRRAGANLNIVHYKGAAPQVIDLLGGQAPIAYTTINNALPHARAGKLHLLAVTGPARHPSAPAAPTMREQGFEGFTANAWFAFFAAAKTPPEVIRKFSAAVQAALDDAEVRKRLDAAGLQPAYLHPAGLGELVRTEMAGWKDTVRATGFKAQD